jgi:hypothetical protein
MKRLLPFILVLFAALFSLNAQADFWGRTVRGNGNVTKETRAVRSFSGISASSGINVYLFQGEEEKVVVEADENLHDCIIVKVEGSLLKCYIDCNVRRSTKMNVYVNFTGLNRISTSSGADVYGETLIVTDELRVDASSAGDVRVETVAGNVYANASSGADILINGKAGYFEADASSGSDIKAKGLVASSSRLNASSGSDIAITVTDNIDARASSGSDIVYYGNPKKQQVNSSSGANIKSR